jgi:hypothetical protein
MKVVKERNLVLLTLSVEEAQRLRKALLITQQDLEFQEPLKTFVKETLKALKVASEPEVSNAQAADAVEAEAERFTARGNSCSWSLEDGADLRNLAWAIRNGDIVFARKLAASLDTAVRDEIPEIAWPFCGL